MNGLMMMTYHAMNHQMAFPAGSLYMACNPPDLLIRACKPFICVSIESEVPDGERIWERSQSRKARGDQKQYLKVCQTAHSSNECIRRFLISSYSSYPLVDQTDGFSVMVEEICSWCVAADDAQVQGGMK